MQFHFRIQTRSHIDDARQAAKQLAIRCGFSELATDQLDGAVAGAAACLIAQTGDYGELLVRPLREEVTGLAAPRIEVIVIPRGANHTAEDLQALSATADEFDWYRTPNGAGVARMALSSSERFSASAHPVVTLGAICAPPPTDDIMRCQPWHIESWLPGSMSVTVVHGLGYGADALQLTAEIHRAANAYMRAPPGIAANHARNAMNIPDDSNLVLAVANIDTEAGRIRLTGMASMVATVVTPTAMQRPFSRPDDSPDDIMTAELEWPAGALLILHCGDVNPDWQLDDYPGLAASHPAMIAAVLYRDFATERGSATVLACRRTSECESLVLENASVSASANALTGNTQPDVRCVAETRLET